MTTVLQSRKTKKPSIAAIVVPIAGALVSACIALLAVGRSAVLESLRGILNLRP